MKIRIIDENIRLIPYYPNEKETLIWYQDLDLCKQVDNIDHVYDLDLLKRMYGYLRQNGYLYYIEYKGKLIGDCSLQFNSELAIVISKHYQNKHIGRKVIKNLIELAKEKKMNKLIAKIYSFNKQSEKTFLSLGFKKVKDEKYELSI